MTGSSDSIFGSEYHNISVCFPEATEAINCLLIEATCFHEIVDEHSWHDGEEVALSGKDWTHLLENLGTDMSSPPTSNVFPTEEVDDGCELCIEPDHESGYLSSGSGAAESAPTPAEEPMDNQHSEEPLTREQKATIYKIHHNCDIRQKMNL